MKKICLILALLMAMATNVQAQEREEPFTPAEYPGGVEALQHFLQNKTHYPKKAEKNGIQGRVLVEFIIDKSGKVTEIQIVQSVDPLLDAEAVRVCKAMPKWKPAYKGGEPVKCSYKLPFNFTLSDEKAKKGKRKK